MALENKTRLLTMRWRRLFLSQSRNARWNEAMFLSNLSECLPRNSLTSSMVFREKGSEGAEGSSAKEMEGQAGYSVHRFLTDGRAGWREGGVHILSLVPDGPRASGSMKGWPGTRDEGEGDPGVQKVTQGPFREQNHIIL